MTRKAQITLCLFLSASLCITPITARQATAHPLTTSDYFSRSHYHAKREQLTRFLSRDDVTEMLISLGVDREEALQRVAHLTEADIQKLTGQLEALPAGGDGLSTVVSAVLLVFFVLLLTDILGLTKVFPFTRAIR